MALRGISMRSFAIKDGCSEMLVRRGLKQGKLIAYDDGSIDQKLAGTPWRRSAFETSPKKGPKPSASGLETFAEAQTRKENYLAKLRELEFQVKSGRLVDVDVARAETFNIARQERDALTNWPGRTAPLIAAEVGADAVVLAVALEKHVREFLAERSNAIRFAG